MDKHPDKRRPHKRRLNCWEVMMCGREQGGKNIAELGVCPAATDPSFDGINSGKYGGRICWAVAGTLCGGCTQGSFVDKRPSCLDCDFYQMVQDEEGMANRRTKFLQFVFQENRSPFFDKMTYRHVKSGERFLVQGAVEDNAYIIQRGSCLVIVEKEGELFILNSTRCDPDQRYQDMDQAMAVLRPLSQDIRPPRIGIMDEKKKSASLILTYSDEIQPAFKQLLDDFKANAQTLGVDVDMIDH